MANRSIARRGAMLAVAALLSSPAAAADLIATHADWKAYRHGEGRDLVCFAVSPAKEMAPRGGERQAPHLYVTAWPNQGIKSELSLLIGLELGRDTEVSVDVGGTSFTLLADGDRAFVADAKDEERLIEAMRRGIRMTVETTAQDGGSIRDAYSLSGVTASLQAITSACPAK